MLLLRYLLAPRPNPDFKDAPVRISAPVCPQSKTTAKVRRSTHRGNLIHYHRPRSTQPPTPALPTMKLFNSLQQRQDSEQYP